MEISNINFLALIVASIVSFAIGAAWYNPAVFGTAWQKALGLKNEDLQNSNMVLIFGSSFLLMLFMNFGLAIILQGHATREITFQSGALYAFLIGVFFNAASIGINMLYQRKSFTLWAIDAGYQVLYLTISGGILGLWR